MGEAGLDITKNALTLNEAAYISSKYQHLKGKKIMTVKGEAEIAGVAISPADEINKWIFLQRFIETDDPATALEFYKVPYYDVVLITRTAGAPLSYIEFRPQEMPAIL